jgi:hypothetical protein
MRFRGVGSLPFPHGYKHPNDRDDARAIEAYLGHLNI